MSLLLAALKVGIKKDTSGYVFLVFSVMSSTSSPLTISEACKCVVIREVKFVQVHSN